MLISSLQNGRIKNIIKLSSRRGRDSQRLTVVEGGREVERALSSGLVPREAFIRASLGAIFSVLVVQMDETAVINWLQENKFNIVAATPAAKCAYDVAMGGKRPLSRAVRQMD